METNSKNSSLWVLALSTGLLLGLSYPPLPFGWLAFIAFAPLFRLLEKIDSYSKVLRFGYLTFLILNVITLYWTGGFTHGKDWYMMVAGVLLLLVHPFFFCLPLLPVVAIRRTFGFQVGVLTFPFLWTSFEYLHSVTQISFPWLMLANTQTYDLPALQFASITGAYGITFWILLINVFVFLLSRQIVSGRWKILSTRVILGLASILLLYILPKWYGSKRLSENAPESARRSIRIGCVQPDIDPFEKWQDDPEYSLSILTGMTRKLGRQPVDLILWPETAITCFILDQNNQFFYSMVRQVVDSLNIPLLTGIPDIAYYSKHDIIPKSSKQTKAGEPYDTFNSSLLLIPRSNSLQRYAKIRLVPFAERVPFSEELSFLNAMKWNFGLGGWGIGRDTTVFRFTQKDGEEIQFSNLICYESIYPGFVASFVKKGAEFLTVITNDSWWGNTSGAYQHERCSVLRAVENHRWLLQCANGGISCAIDPVGRIVKSTEMYSQTTLVQEITLENDFTFYTLHGDWAAELILIFAGFIVMSAIGTEVYVHLRKNQGYEHH
jgi:apolipoprotein N-acyltransferase